MFTLIKIRALGNAAALAAGHYLAIDQGSDPAKRVSLSTLLAYFFGPAMDPYGFRKLAASGVAIVAPTDTNLNILLTVAVPAGSLGPNGRLRMAFVWTCTNNANVKTFQVLFGGGSLRNSSLANFQSHVDRIEMSNAGAVDFQIAGSPGVSSGGVGGTTGAAASLNIDSAVSQNIEVKVQKATGADVVQLRSYIIETSYGA